MKILSKPFGMGFYLVEASTWNIRIRPLKAWLWYPLPFTAIYGNRCMHLGLITIVWDYCFHYPEPDRVENE